MDTVPNIISTKDLAYLSDMFEWNLNAFKQINHYIDEVKNNDIKDLLESVKNMHEDHMKFIISILKKENICDCEECDCEDCSCDEEDDYEE